MGLAGHVARIRNRRCEYSVLVGKPERNDLEDLAVGERIILKEILKEFAVRTWTALVWLRIWTVCWLLWTRWWTSGFNKMRRLPWLATEVAFQQELCSLELLTYRAATRDWNTFFLCTWWILEMCPRLLPAGSKMWNLRYATMQCICFRGHAVCAIFILFFIDYYRFSSTQNTSQCWSNLSVFRNTETHSSDSHTFRPYVSDFPIWLSLIFICSIIVSV